MSFSTKATLENWKGKEVKIQGKKVVNKSAFEIGLVVEGQAKLLCAVNYGYLAASITTQSDTKGTELENPSKYAKEVPPTGHQVSSFKKIENPNSDNEVLVGTPVDYAPHVEYGTVRMNAQPFLRPSLDLAKGKAIAIITVNGKQEFKEYFEQHESYLREKGIK